MNDNQKQHMLSGIGWLNIVTLSPVLFLTIIFNAQFYILKIHTTDAMRLLAHYGVQILILLFLFVCAFLLQMNRDLSKKWQSLIFLMFASICLFLFEIVQFVQMPQLKHVYGGVLLSFLQSYIGLILFLCNIGVGFFLCRTHIEQYMTKKSYGVFLLFGLLVFFLYFLR